MPKVIAQSTLKRGEGVAFWVGVTIFLAGIVARQLDVIIKHYFQHLVSFNFAVKWFSDMCD